MKYSIFFLFTIVLLYGCSKNQGQRNPYLAEQGFQTQLNLNLPLYAPLTNTGNAIYVSENNGGIRGFFVINTGFNTYLAFEASCPNHEPSTCSTMKLKGQTVTCSCEDYEYNLFTGQFTNKPNNDTQYHDLLNYRANYSNNTVTVSN